MVAVSAACAGFSFLSHPAGVFAGIVTLFVSYPLFLWAGMRSSPFSSSLISLLMSLIGVIGILRGSGGLIPLSRSVDERVLIFQLFATFLASVSLILSSAYARRFRAETALKSSERRLKLIIESMSDPVVIIGPDGTRRFISTAVERITGFSPEELAGMSPQDFIHPDDMPRVREGIQAMMGKPAASITLRFKHRKKNGGWVDIEASCINLVEDPVIAGILVNARDITERTRVEMELKSAKTAAEKAGEAAMKALEVKGVFLSNMSHEIRTPLTGMLGMASLLSKSGLNETQRGYVERLTEAGKLLLAIVNDILDLEKLESGTRKPRMEAVDVKRLCAGIVNSFEHAASAKSITLAAVLDELPEKVETDPQILSQILVNLIGNAVKFTERGGVRLVAHQETGENDRTVIMLEVHDTEMGIPKEGLAVIFERFSQMDSSYSKRHEGTGLGLSIARHLLLLLGGSMSVESEVGKGSVFAVRFPCQVPDSTRGESNAESAQARGEDTPAAGTLIVAEDNQINLLFFRTVLETEGYRVLTAIDGKGVLELLSELPDMILLDVQMPEIDGIECARAIRSSPDPRVRSLPIVALTGYAMEGDLERCLAAGMDAYLQKPFDEVELLHLVKKRKAEIQ
jgi:PAS domain S-box-containing protein